MIVLFMELISCKKEVIFHKTGVCCNATIIKMSIHTTTKLDNGKAYDHI